MHWCDLRHLSPNLREPVDFGSALRRATAHYENERRR
jgi:hypothetical protein